MTLRTEQELVLAVGQAMRHNDPDTLEACAAELEALDTLATRANALNARAVALEIRGQPEEALSTLNHALDLYEELGDQKGIASTHNQIGIVYGHIGKYTDSIDHHHRSLALNEARGDRGGTASALCNIGNVYNDIGLYPDATSYFERALTLFIELGNKAFEANTIGNIGNTYWHTGNYPAALEQFHRSLDVHTTLNNRQAMASLHNSIASLHVMTKDFPRAVENFHLARNLYEALDDAHGMALITSNLIETCLMMGSFDEAEQLMPTLDTLKHNYPHFVIQREIFRAAFSEHRGQLDEAVQTLQHALQQALNLSMPTVRADIHKHLRDLSLQRNDLPGYVEHNNEFTRITEEINGKDTATKLAMQAKQREIDANNREHEKHMAVLHSTLPKHIADRVARGEVVNDSFDNAAVLFLDVVGFTTNSSELGANVVVDMLQQIFTAFDAICAEHNVMKIKTIGDSYMAVAFPSEHHVEDLASVALAMQASVFTWPHTGKRVMFRIGLHCGPVVAGVLGTERMQYDVWGDTVNVASRMESSGEPGRVHVSEAYANNLKSNTEYRIQNSMSESENQESHEVPLVTSHSSLVTQLVTQLVTRHSSLVTQLRGSFDIKGKGMMKTYWLENITT